MADRESRLSFEEFMGEPSRAERLFRLMDKDRDGFVTKAEFKEVCKNLNKEQIEATFKKFDQTGNDKLSFREFRDMMSKRSELKGKKVKQHQGSEQSGNNGKQSGNTGEQPGNNGKQQSGNNGKQTGNNEKQSGNNGEQSGNNSGRPNASSNDKQATSSKAKTAKEGDQANP